MSAFCGLLHQHQHAQGAVLSGSEMPQHRACKPARTPQAAPLCSAACLAPWQRDRLLQVVPTSNTVIGGWLSAVPSNGTVAPGKVAEVVLMYNVSANPFQGTFAADVLITTSARPVAMVRDPSAPHGDPYAVDCDLLGWLGSACGTEPSQAWSAQ